MPLAGGGAGCWPGGRPAGIGWLGIFGVSEFRGRRNCPIRRSRRLLAELLVATRSVLAPAAASRDAAVAMRAWSVRPLCRILQMSVNAACVGYAGRHDENTA